MQRSVQNTKFYEAFVTSCITRHWSICTQATPSPARAKPQRARRGYALAPLALQQKAIMAMLRACHSAQAFSQEALSSDELFSGLGTFSFEVGALQRCLGDTGKGTCVHLCRAGLAALRDIEAHVRELLEAGAGMRELLEYMKRGAAPWGKFTTKSSSEFVLMQTGLSLVVRPRG